MSRDVNVQQVRGAREAGEADATALQPGALTGYENHQWTFTGNGVITPTDVMGRIIEIDAQRQPELTPFVRNQDAARLSAAFMLQRMNAQLPDRSPDSPVPENVQFHATGGPTLKALLAPFANNLDRLREAVAAAGNGDGTVGEVGNKMTGRVRTPGLGLPTDPRV